MGHYKNGNYYRGKDDGDLQWIEDLFNLTFSMVFYGFCAIASGLWILACGLFNLITANNGRDN